MGDNEGSSPPAHNVVDPYGGATITVGAAAPSPGAPVGDANNVMTLHVPNVNTTLSLGGVGPMTEDFEKGTSPGFNLQTGGDFNYEVTGNWKGHVGANTAFHFSGTQEVETELPWLDVKHAIQVELVVGATQETFIGAKHELIVGGQVSHVYAYKNEFTTGWVNETINGPETTTNNGTVTETVNGNESTTLTGNSTESIYGNETKQMWGTAEDTLHGNEFSNVYGNSQEMITGTKQEKLKGKWECEGTVFEMGLESNAQIHAVDMEHKASGTHTTEGKDVKTHATSSHTTEAPTVHVKAAGQLTVEGEAGAKFEGSGAVVQASGDGLHA
jgi:hypothetical protein